MNFQSKVIKKMQSEGFFVVKLIRCSINGMPDLMCLKDGKAVFVECKEKWDTVKPLQEYRIKQLNELGFEAYVKKNI